MSLAHRINPPRYPLNAIGSTDFCARCSQNQKGREFESLGPCRALKFSVRAVLPHHLGLRAYPNNPTYCDRLQSPMPALSPKNVLTVPQSHASGHFWPAALASNFFARPHNSPVIRIGSKCRRPLIRYTTDRLLGGPGHQES
jgi:hypothetical protein